MLTNRPPARPLRERPELTRTALVTDGDTVRISFAGELDIASAPMFVHAIGEVLDDEPHRRIRVDFTEVQFLDSAGISALLKCWQRAEDRGRELVVVDPRPGVRRILEITGVFRLLCPTDDAATAPAQDVT
jgi:anti-sigma B factor antagonist